MNPLLLILAFLVFSQCNNQTRQSETENVIGLDSMVLVDSVVHCNVRSDEPFYVGGNEYIFHVGEYQTAISRLTDTEHSSLISFFIPKKDFDQLVEGATMFLTYGEYFPHAESEDNQAYWDLGVFKKTMLNE